MHEILIATHIGAGSLALAIMWVPMFTRKGRRAHRIAGWSFVGAMGVVAATALILSARLLVVRDLDRGLFLLFLSVLTVNFVSTGLRALRAKSRTGAHLNAWDIGTPILVIVTGLAAAWRGLSADDPGILAIAVAGAFVGVNTLRYWLSAPAAPMHWRTRHMISMLSTCFAAAAAFTTNFDDLGIWPGSTAAIAVLGILGVPSIAAWVFLERRKSSARVNVRRPAPLAGDAPS